MAVFHVAPSCWSKCVVTACKDVAASDGCYPKPMELPLAGNTAGQLNPHASAQTSDDALVRALKRADVILARTGAEESYLTAATAYVDADRSKASLMNVAFDLRLSEEITPSDAIKEIVDHFGSQGSVCHYLNSMDLDWPTELVEAATANQFAAVTMQIDRLVNYARPDQVDEQMQVIPGRAAYQEMRSLYYQNAIAVLSEQAGDDADSNAQVQIANQIADAAMDQFDEARIDVFLARENKQPVGLMSLLTLGNIGVLSDVVLLPTLDQACSSRVMASLFGHVIDCCVRAQFEQVLVRGVQGDRELAFYEQYGFEQAVQYTRYVNSTDI